MRITEYLDNFINHQGKLVQENGVRAVKPALLSLKATCSGRIAAARFPSPLFNVKGENRWTTL